VPPNDPFLTLPLSSPTRRINGVVGAVYVGSMFTAGHYIVLNLFLAILLDNFQQANHETKSTFYDEMEKQNDAAVAIGKFVAFLKTLFGVIFPFCSKKKEMPPKQEEEPAPADAAENDESDDERASGAQVIDDYVDDTARQSSSNEPETAPAPVAPASNWFGNLTNALFTGAENVTHTISDNIHNVAESVRADSVDGGTEVARQDEEKHYQLMLEKLRQDADEHANDKPPAPPSPSKAPPIAVECIREPYDLRSGHDELLDFALDHASEAVSKIHANVVAIYTGDKGVVVSEVDTRHLTDSTRMSVDLHSLEALQQGESSDAESDKSLSSANASSRALAVNSKVRTPSPPARARARAKRAKRAQNALAVAAHERLLLLCARSGREWRAGPEQPALASLALFFCARFARPQNELAVAARQRFSSATS
jgi:hypothetical protein